MKKTLLSLVLIPLLLPAAAWSQDRIYRCGNEYTNNASQARERGCKLVEGGNVTVLGTTPSRPATGSAGGLSGGAASSSPASAPKVGSNDQRARDADARAILESELRKAETRQAELSKEYNNGAPERNALDLRNPQRYMERTEELKSALARAESDVAGIKRELGRLPTPTN
ncbi:MAG: hypothetical protein F9K35_03960 [Burkholderiaceae bacterium]|nr:MAG: hypothetical protein F9K35_03960 [Burkholderiaceae bacterium]